MGCARTGRTGAPCRAGRSASMHPPPLAPALHLSGCRGWPPAAALRCCRQASAPAQLGAPRSAHPRCCCRRCPPGIRPRPPGAAVVLQPPLPRPLPAAGCRPACLVPRLPSAAAQQTGRLPQWQPRPSPAAAAAGLQRGRLWPDCSAAPPVQQPSARRRAVQVPPALPLPAAMLRPLPRLCLPALPTQRAPGLLAWLAGAKAMQPRAAPPHWLHQAPPHLAACSRLCCWVRCRAGGPRRWRFALAAVAAAAAARGCRQR